MSLRPASAFLATACLLGIAIFGPGCDDDTTAGPPDLAPIT